MAGGRDGFGFWLSTDTAHYMPGFCTKCWAWPSLSPEREIRRLFLCAASLKQRLPRAKNEVWYLGSQAPSGGRRATRVDVLAV